MCFITTWASVVLTGYEQVVSWVPVEVVANALNDLRVCIPDTKNRIVHLVHPRPVAWDQILGCLAKQLKLSTIPYDTWLIQLKVVATDNKKPINATYLIPHFSSLNASDTSHSDNEAFGMNTLSCREAVACSAALSFAKPISDEDIFQWIGYWERAGILSSDR